MKEKMVDENARALPLVQKVSAERVQQVYAKIKQDIEEVINKIMTKVNKDPGQAHLRLLKG